MKQNIKERLAAAPSAIKGAFCNPQVWGFFVSMAVAAVLAIAFFYPDASMGNQLRQHDMQQGAAISHEVKAYAEANGGEEPRWTNALFSGMPTFQITPTYPSDSLFSWITKVYGLGLPSPSNLLFMMMFGFLILMACMRVRWYYGLIGAVAWCFSTYFIIIIGAGHIWKFVTLAYIPPTLGGIILAYRGRYLAGSAIAALFAMMQIISNHVQMSYYFLFVVLALSVAFLVNAIREKRVRRWLAATGALAVAACLAVCANLPNLYNTYKYSKESMRGAHSELSADPAKASEKTAGLDRDYITQYSYGRSETFSLLIPNIKGGASAKPVAGQMVATSVMDLPGAEEAATRIGLNEAERQYVAGYVGQYFGEPEGTNGPVYVGAIIFTLFILGCIIVKGPVKWALLVATLLSVFLALGRNMQWFTDLFIDYVPMYSRFRTVESILVVAEFTIPLLAILALQKLLTTPGAFDKYKKALYASFGAAAFFCIVGWLFPQLYGPAISEGDQQLSDMIAYQLQQGGYPADAVAMFSISNPAIAAVVENLRYGLVKADSLRSLVFILLAFGALMLCLRGKVKAWMGVTVIALLVCADLYSVDKRYLSHDSFCSPELSASDPFPMTPNDRAILADTTMNFRVMDIPGFYQAAPSYRHKTIGGYHAAKLTRYQDLIDRHLGNIARGAATEADMRVLDMLNARYIITPDGQLAFNDQAMGNAWFVDSVVYVPNADAEMAALSQIDLRHVAVADEKFKPVLGTADAPAATPGEPIVETTYAPDRLTYKYSSEIPRVAVFSEVYFPWGWEAEIDGKPAEIGRVNYLLRAVKVPAGTHRLEMRFAPRSVTATVATARVAVILIYVLCLAALLYWLLGGKTPEEEKKAPADV